MNEQQVLHYIKEKQVAIITLQRPDSYNAMNHDITRAMLSSLRDASADINIRAIVLQGSGPGFSAGADLRNFGEQAPDAVTKYIVEYYGEIVRLIMEAPKPVIAAIHGSAAGVATAFALACDFRVMEEGANLRYAFINIGLGPDGGAAWLLARAVGYSKALEIAIHGEKIPAAECFALGLCNKLVPTGEASSAALAWAFALSQRPTLGIAITKQAMHHAANHTLYETIQLEALNQAKALMSQDHQEGVVAFLQKREPNFIGK